MKRIGNLLIVITGLCLTFSAAILNIAEAQDSDVTVEATVSENIIFSGERFRLSIEISGNFNNVTRPSLPEFENLRLLSNNPSISRQFNMVNGVSSTTYSYSYFLIAQDEGEYRIAPIEVEVDGNIYETKPIAVTVKKQSDVTENENTGGREDIFVDLDLSERAPVTGQQLIVDVVLYFKSGLEVNSYQPVPGWKAEGFWKEELENDERPRAESIILDGVRYRKARLLQFSLFPTKVGELTISPFEIIVSVRSSTRRDDPFGSLFGGFGSNQRRLELQTDPISINVKRLPSPGNATYIGGVGQYDISRSLKNKNVYVGESIEIETEISGVGNIPLISKPDYTLPDGLEVYEPQESSSINRRGQRISGKKSFIDVIIARTPGTYTIPEARLAYFNPIQNRFITEILPAITFTVERNPEAGTNTPESLTFNLQPVTGLATWITTDRSDSLIANWWFWLGILIPLAVLSLGYWQKTYQDKMNTDREFARSQKAYDVAMQRLEEALEISNSGNLKDAYNILHKALTGYIGDRMGLPEAGLSDQKYVELLNDRNIDQEIIKNIRMLLDKCSTISYAPNISHTYLKSHLGMARNLIDQLKKEL